MIDKVKKSLMISKGKKEFVIIDTYILNLIEGV